MSSYLLGTAGRVPAISPQFLKAVAAPKHLQKCQLLSPRRVRGHTARAATAHPTPRQPISLLSLMKEDSDSLFSFLHYCYNFYF